MMNEDKDKNTTDIITSNTFYSVDAELYYFHFG